MFLKEMRYLISQIRHLISHLINGYKKYLLTVNELKRIHH